MHALIAGHPLKEYTTVTSTQEIARDLILQGAAEGTVVLASEQTAGRGRLGRKWIAPAGTSILTSLILKPPFPLSDFYKLSFLAAWATAEAIAFMADVPVQVKWPNDILIEGRKVAGILIESAADSSGDPWAIMGIGVNVNIPRDAFPEELKPCTTSVAEAQGFEMPLKPLLKAILEHFDRGWQELLAEGFASILKHWQTLDATRGRPVKVITPAETLEGIALGVDESGNLQLQLADRTIRTVVAGDVILR